MAKSEKLTEIVESTVLCSRTGRSLASIGAILTNVEKKDMMEIYSRLNIGEEITDDSPVTALITSRKGRASKIAIKDAVDWFIMEYSKDSLPLQQKMSEKKPGATRLLLNYGLKENQDFSDEDYINTIISYTNCQKNQAALLYYGFLKPLLQESDELKGLTEVKIE